MLFPSLDDALDYKKANEYLLNKILRPVEMPLLKIIILQMTPSGFGEMWAKQRLELEDVDVAKIISDEEFEKQLIAFDNIDLAKKEGCLYQVIGLFRLTNGEPHFEPVSLLLSCNSMEIPQITQAYPQLEE